MAENYNSDSEKKSIVQRFLDLFKKTSNEVKEKVQDTVEDVKSSDFGGKVADVAENVRDKAKDVVEDIKDSKFAEKVGDVAENVRDKAKDVVEDIKDSKFAEKVGNFRNLRKTLLRKKICSMRLTRKWQPFWKTVSFLPKRRLFSWKKPRLSVLMWTSSWQKFAADWKTKSNLHFSLYPTQGKAAVWGYLRFARLAFPPSPSGTLQRRGMGCLRKAFYIFQRFPQISAM